MNEEIENFLIYLATEKGDSKKTLEAYKKDLQQFFDYFSSKNKKEITLEDFSEYLIYLNDKKYKRTSIIRKSTAIKTFLKFFKNENKTSIVISEIKIPKKERKLPDILTISEVSLLFSAPDIKTYKGLLDLVMIEMCYYCGLRVSELCNLKIEDINFTALHLKVLGKGSKERIVPFSEELASYLTLYLHQREKIVKPFVFVHQNGKRVSRQYLFLEIKKYALEKGIKKNIHPHLFRHTFATNLLENGANLRQVQALLGHKNIETTEIYTHVSKKKEREIYDKAMKR